jgi:hypothetical protein
MPQGPGEPLMNWVKRWMRPCLLLEPQLNFQALEIQLNELGKKMDEVNVFRTIYNFQGPSKPVE